MVFSSLLFVFFFFPFVIFLYFLAKNQYRNYILLAASILFYAYGEPAFVFVMLSSILMNYIFGLSYCMAMLGYYGMPFFADGKVIYYLREYGFFIAAGMICAVPALKNPGVIARCKRWAAARVIAVPVCYGICFFWAVSYLILGAHNPFIYFNF